jgi:fumarate reductase subunit D
MARSNEPAVWSLFAAGGAWTALLLPAHVAVLAILLPLLQADAAPLWRSVLLSPVFRAYAFVTVFLGLVHGAHRLRYALVDMGLGPIAGLVSWLCYGGAVVGTVVAFWILALSV